jgi:hypothetical protein
VGFGADLNEQQYLNGNAVSELNPDLESGPKLISAARLPENKAIAFEGTKKYGDFEISGELARGWLLEPRNKWSIQCRGPSTLAQWTRFFFAIIRPLDYRFFGTERNRIELF